CGEFLGPMRDKKYLGYIEDIHSSGLHLLAIINDVLDMSKIEAGKLELASEIVTVQRVINESIRMVSERANSRNIELVSDLAGAGGRYGGTGLGLPISKGLIEAHHGQLVIDSSPGRGTRVRVILPPHAAAPVPVSGAKPRASRKARDDRAVA